MQKKDPFSQKIKRNDIRIPPQNLDIERALLGTLLIRPESIFEINDIVKPDNFYLPAHGIIFDSMLELSARQQPIDMLSVMARIKEKKQER